MKRVGLFVGIDEYQNGIPKLSCASADAVNMFGAFKAAGFSANLLLDKKASSESIIGQIQSLMDKLNAGDLFVFYFAGHGREHNADHYLIGANGYSDSSLYMLGSLPLSAVVSLTDKVPGLQRFFILDCCRKNLTSDRAGEPFQCDNSRNIALNNAVVQNSDSRIIPPLILSSCSTGQMAYENLQTHQGYFTEKFISVIGDKKTVSFSQLQSALTLSVKNQDVDWKGPITRWNDIRLFEHWGNKLPTPPSDDIAKYELGIYKPDVEELLKKCDGKCPPEIIRIYQTAKKAEDDGNYSVAVHFLKSVKDKLEAFCRNAEEEARRKTEEEERRKAEEEERRKAEEEARCRAEEEARCKAEEEARRKAEEEARRTAEEEARRKAEEEARRKAEEKAARLKAEVAAHERQEKQRKEILSGKVELPGGHILQMVPIQPGTFTMGSPAGIKGGFLGLQTIGAEEGRSEDEIQHRVTLTKPFWLGKYPVTQLEYESVMGKNPSKFNGANLPVERVSWYDAKEFCKKLNEIHADKLPAGYQFDLPTEAQWEYACRAGTTTALNNGKDLTSDWGWGECSNLNEVAWYDQNSGKRTHEVGQKRANAWGLYDMHGNVWEWCRDWYGYYPYGSITDPVGPSSGSSRVIRGGSWNSVANDCRSAVRGRNDPSDRGYDRGFRLALVPIQ